MRRRCSCFFFQYNSIYAFNALQNGSLVYLICEEVRVNWRATAVYDLFANCKSFSWMYFMSISLNGETPHYVLSARNKTSFVNMQNS